MTYFHSKRGRLASPVLNPAQSLQQPEQATYFVGRLLVPISTGHFQPEPRGSCWVSVHVHPRPPRSQPEVKLSIPHCLPPLAEAGGAWVPIGVPNLLASDLCGWKSSRLCNLLAVFWPWLGSSLTSQAVAWSLDPMTSWAIFCAFNFPRISHGSSHLAMSLPLPQGGPAGPGCL